MVRYVSPGPTYDFSGSVVVITGGARGQGLSHALGFAKSGADVVVLDYGKERLRGIPYGLSGQKTLDRAAKLLNEFKVRSKVLAVDVTQEKAVKDAFALVSETFAGVDVLVNNAGVNAQGAVGAVTREAWNAVMNVNLLGSFLCCKHAVPLMRRNQGGGRLVNVASVAAMKGMANQVQYSASKAGIVGLTRALAVERWPDAIAVNAVCPTIVDSPMTDGLRATDQGLRPPRPKAGARRSHVLRGFASLSPNDVTQAVLWLSSDAARFVTGQVIVIDAGLSIR